MVIVCGHTCMARHETLVWTYVSCHDTYGFVIQSFKDERTRAAFEGVQSKGFPADLLSVTRRKLSYLNAATTLNDLRAPPRKSAGSSQR
jgi:hypothetical protein